MTKPGAITRGQLTERSGKQAAGVMHCSSPNAPRDWRATWAASSSPDMAASDCAHSTGADHTRLTRPCPAGRLMAGNGSSAITPRSASNHCQAASRVGRLLLKLATTAIWP